MANVDSSLGRDKNTQRACPRLRRLSKFFIGSFSMLAITVFYFGALLIEVLCVVTAQGGERC